MALSDFYRQLEEASRLPHVYVGNRDMRAQSDSPFVEGFMDGRNIRNSILAENEAIADKRRAEEYRKQMESQLGGQTRGQIPDSPYDPTQMHGLQDNSWGQAIGKVLYQGRPEQTAPIVQAQAPSGVNIQGSQSPFNWGSVLGGKGVNFQNPSSDIPQAQAEGGVKQSPNVLNQPNTIREYLGQRGVGTESPQFGADYGLQQWLKDDRENGVTNPLISLMRYQAFIDPMVQQARQDDLRNAFAIYNNQNATPEERNNAIAKMEFYLKKPYMQEDRNWMDESRQMQRENHRANLNYRNAQANGLLSSGSGFVDRVRDLQGRIGYNAPDGTNCMRTMGIALSGTPYEGQINVDQAVSTAKELGDLHVSGDGYKPRPGDMAVVNGGKHVVMLTENGGTIQNGESHNGVYEDPRSPEQIFGKVNYWISSSRYAGGGGRRRGIGAFSRTRLDSAYEKQLQKMQENYNKNVEDFRQNAIDLSNFGDIAEDDEKGKKAYEESMNKLVKNVKGLCDAYKESGSKMNPTQFGIALYHKINEDPTGLTPEQLAEAVAKAVAVKRGGVDPNKLYDDILNEVYSKKETGDGNLQGDNGKGQPTDPVDDLSYEDRQGGVYNVGGVRMSESMYNKINNIRPYEETLKEKRMRFAQEQESAQNRAQFNQNEWEKMFDENEKYYGI